MFETVCRGLPSAILISLSTCDCQEKPVTMLFCHMIWGIEREFILFFWLCMSTVRTSFHVLFFPLPFSPLVSFSLSLFLCNKENGLSFCLRFFLSALCVFVCFSVCFGGHTAQPYSSLFIIFVCSTRFFFASLIWFLVVFVLQKGKKKQSFFLFNFHFLFFFFCLSSLTLTYTHCHYRWSFLFS